MVHEKKRGSYRLDKRKAFRFLRYCIGALALSAFLVFFINVIFFGVLAYQYVKLTPDEVDGGKVWEALTRTQEGYVLDARMQQKLSAQNQWAMLLDEDGQVIWSYRKPEEIGLNYGRSDIARMTRWYLKGYPVHLRVWEDKIMVVGSEKDSMWKYGLEFSMPWISVALHGGVCLVLANIIWIVLLAVFLTRRWMQNRERARIEWIAGISHDIRTPLSMVMGYAAVLENDESLPEEERRQAAIIKHQSVIMKELITDLNLTSRLDDSMQALRQEKVRPAAVLREVAADFLNDAAENALEITLHVAEGAEEAAVLADRQLLIRACRNLIQNSVQHGNQEGTVKVEIHMEKERHKCHIIFEDNGKGYPLSVPSENRDDAQGIRGLEIVRKIVAAHRGSVRFGNRSTGGSFCEIWLKIIA